jgi:hypothetical protein
VRLDEEDGALVKIVAGCVWFMEPPEFLSRLVLSLAPLADAFLAIDGPWDGFDHDLPCSTPEEHDAIAEAAAEIRMPLRVVQHDRVWESQVEKRSELFRVAIDEMDADWVLVVDGDEVLVDCDADAVRRSLELTDRDVVEAMSVPMNRLWPYDRLPSYERPIRHMYRGLPGLRVERGHNGIVTFDGRWLHGDQAFVRREPALDLSRVLRFAHDNDARPAERRAAARRERRRRSELRLEWSR